MLTRACVSAVSGLRLNQKAKQTTLLKYLIQKTVSPVQIKPVKSNENFYNRNQQR